jgi:hypothetical protein
MTHYQKLRDKVASMNFLVFRNRQRACSTLIRQAAFSRLKFTLSSFMPYCLGTDTNVMTKTSIWCSPIQTINQKRLSESYQIPLVLRTPLSLTD